MDHAATIQGAPRKLLFATDLSARCDRALERAVSLATGWDAQLVIVHALENIRDSTDVSRRSALPSWHRPPDAVAIARRRVAQGLRADLGNALKRAAVFVEEGEPADIIERVATAEGCDLVVTGIAREEPFVLHPYTLGKTVDRLLRRSPLSILIVRNRVRSAYERVVVGTDFSDSSGHALQAALRMFPTEQLRLLYAHEALYVTQVIDPARYQDAHQHEPYREALEGQLETFLASLSLPDEARHRIHPLIEFGPPEALFRDYVFHHEADLVVLGTHGRHAALEAVIGSTAKRMVSMLPCDALIVRQPPPAAHAPR